MSAPANWLTRRGLIVAVAFLVLIVLIISGVAVAKRKAESSRAFAESSCGYSPEYNGTNYATDPTVGEDYFRRTVTADGFLVATNSPYATAAACRILADGGTAADAVVAAQYTLGLVEPQSSGPGGGALAVYFDSDSSQVEVYNASVFAPRGDTAEDSVESSDLLRVGVPQTDRLMERLQKDHGSKKLSDLTEPAAQLAEGGFTVSPRLAEAAGRRSSLFEDGAPGSFLQVDGSNGRVPTAGDTARNSAYAEHLRAVADRGATLSEADAAGIIDQLGTISSDPDDRAQAEALVADWQGGDASSLSAAEALCTRYRGHEVCGSADTGTGNMVVAEALGILDHLDLARLTPKRSGDDVVARSTAAHLMSEAQRIAFANANTWMADPAANPDRSRSYLEHVVQDASELKKKAKSIHQKRSLDSPQADELPFGGDYEDSEDEGTSQITVRDADGNTASVTTTLQRDFGSGLAVNGYFLNNSLDNFSASATEGEPNGRAGGRHPRTTMAPLVVTRDGAAVLALGSPGGRKIPAYNLKALVGVLDWNLSPYDAIRMPNFGADNRNSVFVEARPPGEPDENKKLRDRLEEWGQNVDGAVADSGLAVISVDGEQLTGGADPRRHGLIRGGGSP